MRERYWHSGRTPANSLLALFLCWSMLGAQAQQQQAPSTPTPQQQQQQTPNAPTPQARTVDDVSTGAAGDSHATQPGNATLA